MKKLLLLFMALGLTATSFGQMTISDVKIPGSLKVNGEELLLNGAGLREKFFLDLYVGALYTNGKSSDADAVIGADEPMAITLDIVSSLVTQDKMIDSVEEGFENSTPRKQRKALQSRIDQFIKLFSSPIVEGDQFILSYMPNTGTIVYKNGEKLGTIEGLDFKKGLTAIWLGDDPADDDLRDALLGK